MSSRFSFLFKMLVFIALSFICLSVHLTKLDSKVAENSCPKYLFTTNFRPLNMLNTQKFASKHSHGVKTDSAGEVSSISRPSLPAPLCSVQTTAGSRSSHVPVQAIQ